MRARGGFSKRGGTVGDVYCCDEFKHHDRRVPIPGYDALCVGHRRATPAPGLVKALSLKTGLCTTGNSLDCSPTDAPIIEESGAVCKDMEAASLAHAAELSGTPFLAIKVVTDIVDGPHATQDEFLANLSTALEGRSRRCCPRSSTTSPGRASRALATQQSVAPFGVHPRRLGLRLDVVVVIRRLVRLVLVEAARAEVDGRHAFWDAASKSTKAGTSIVQTHACAVGSAPGGRCRPAWSVNGWRPPFRPTRCARSRRRARAPRARRELEQAMYYSFRVRF